MIEKFFFGGVTPKGFSTELTQLINGKEYYTYILKGGPGTGKSRTMRIIAERFSKDEKVTSFYCSSDPNSLDAVMLHTSKVMVVDGTPPHVSEPRIPGVCQEIIPLGECWDKAVLKENRDKIIEATELNKSMMAAATGYNKALGLICDDTCACAEGFCDRQRIEEEVRCLCESLLEGRERKAARGKQLIRQLSVMTRYGYMTLPDAAESSRKLYLLNDERFAASSLFIDSVATRMTDYGFDTKLSTCLLSGRPFREHLLIDELGVALMTSNPLTRLEDEKAQPIDCSAFYDRDRMEPYEKHFESNRSLIDGIAESAREMLENAKQVHDEMEGYYADAMDYDELEKVREKLYDEIEDRARACRK